MSAAREHVAWLRYTERGSIITCDSDAPKAFKVYRDAAAPELLAALTFVADTCEQVALLESCGERDFLRGLAKSARAEIAKATGADK